MAGRMCRTPGHRWSMVINHDQDHQGDDDHDHDGDEDQDHHGDEDHAHDGDEDHDDHDYGDEILLQTFWNESLR